MIAATIYLRELELTLWERNLEMHHLYFLKSKYIDFILDAYLPFLLFILLPCAVLP